MAARFTSVAPGGALSDQVANAIHAQIRTSKFVSGDKLPTETMLVKHFGARRAVLREAISRWTSLGLIQTRQGSGAFVKAACFSSLQFNAGSAASKRAVIQMVDARRALQAEVAALAAPRRNDEDVKRIHRAESVPYQHA